MTHAAIIGVVLLGALADGEVVITFDKVETGKPVASYTAQEALLAISRRPGQRGRATLLAPEHEVGVELGAPALAAGRMSGQPPATGVPGADLVPDLDHQ